jgi:hydrogenase small subunit
VLNTVHPDIVEVLTETISLEFHPSVMAASGDLAMSVAERAIAELKGKFVLVVEGSIPTGEHLDYCTVGEREGKPVTIEEWIKELGGAAQAVLAVGTCAAFGGIPAGRPNPTEAKSVRDVIPEATIISIPGCPAHPDWVVGTVAHVLLFGVPELDRLGRPKMFYGKLVHEQCERRADFENDRMAADFGDEGCLYGLGCKGPIAYCDTPIRGWNSGSPCIGCTEPTFPDHEGEGLYARLPIEKTYGIAWTGPYAGKKALAG